jgi:calnexin
MRKSIAFAAACALAAAEDDAPPAPPAAEIPASVAGAAFFEPFLDNWESTWKVSKDADFSGRWMHEPYAVDPTEDKGLVVGDAARKHAVSTLFKTPFDPKGKGLVIQYELQLKKGLQCGGAYLKLLRASDQLDAEGFKAETPYTIMFGPDKCGETNKVHFILQHQNPKSGAWEEKHLASKTVPSVDTMPHLYTAIVGADNTVKILVDNKEVTSASLLSDTDFVPPVNPPKQIDDPEDQKPEDWVDEAMMDEPGASKPDDWDEDAPKSIPDPKAEKPGGWLDDAPDMVPDPTATMPGDWDADEDGEWEAPLIKNPDCEKHGCGEWAAPLIPNPDYKGKWSAPRVDNPAYKGVWAPRKIDNPHYVVDDNPHAMAPIGGIGIELWTMQDGILFDNILLTHDAAVASDLAGRTHALRKAGMDAKRKAEERSSLEYGEGPIAKMRYYMMRGVYYAQDNPLVVGLSLCLGIIPLLLWCCMGGGSSSKKEEDDEDDDAVDQADGAEAEEEEEEEEEEPAVVEEEPEKKEEPAKPKGGAKKRTPKAS